jgi:dipeptidyl aminopeptidase/acylaminoacyl peptidase
MRIAAFVALVFVSSACGPSLPAPPPPPFVPTPPGSASAAPVAPATGAPTGSAYSGHGASTVPPEVLAKYAAPRLDPAVSRRIQAMLDVRAPGVGAVSSDGKKMFFTWTITGTRQIWRIDGPQRFPVEMTGGEDPSAFEDITPDGKYLVVSRDRKGEEYPGVYLLDPKGGPLVVVQHKPKVQTMYQFTTDDSRHLYFRANDVKPDSYAIYRYDLQTKERELVFGDDGIWSVADHQGMDKLLLVKEVGSNMEEYFEYVPSTKKLTPLFGQGERENHEAAYGALPGEILVLTPKLGEFRRLYRWKEGKLTPVTAEMKHDVASFSIDHGKTRILYTVNENGYSRPYALDAKTFKEIKLPKLPPADQVYYGFTTRDGKFTSLKIDTGVAPPESYVITWATGQLVKWHSPSAPEVDMSKFVRASLEEYTARDGTKIPMFVRRPANCDKPCPVIVTFHGGPEGQATPGFSTATQLFVDAGFTIVEPNVRGSDGYGRTWLHADDGAKRLAIITDIEDVAKFIKDKWAVGGKAPKIGVAGGSYGGYSTLVAMTMFAGTYDAGASVVGISNLYTFLMNTAPYRRALRISEYGDPEKDKDALMKLSPITYIDKVKSPLLIIQGATDPRVPAGEAIQIKAALDAKKTPSELIIFPDEGHGAQKRENQVLQLGHMVRFFEEHLLDTGWVTGRAK